MARFVPLVRFRVANPWGSRVRELDGPLAGAFWVEKVHAVFGAGRRARVSGSRSVFGPLRRVLPAGRFFAVLLTVVAVLAGSATSVSAAPAVAATPSQSAAPPKPGDFGPGAAKSADLAIDGWGDAK